MKINLNRMHVVLMDNNISTIDERNKRHKMPFKFPSGSDENNNYESYYANGNILGF
jgi:hypothetical protein